MDEKHSLLYHGIVAIEKRNKLEEIPVLGCPKYTHGDIVRVKWEDTEKCLYKHITESEILGKVER